ncbi:hypothetical protein Goklo_008236 [Gossypium klotzschianum]|uniref:DUF4283 domain-containing protein n=1 Tax=Gossypium klotzschianum TaxID=34286 RepID=A0A7J8UZ55_9ROSI|nr:hypothetical protein [Gossypium klotzschianum]
MARQTAMDVGNALGELIVIDWKDRFGGWIEFMRLKVKIDVLKPLRRVVKLVDKEGPEYKGKERSCKEESLSISPMDRRNQKTIRDGMGRFKSKRKRQRGQNGKNLEESPARIVKRRIFENVSSVKEVAGGQPCQEP